MKIKVGSLFDGIGGAPLSAVLSGAEPVWASEIEKIPTSITKRHFPNMKHYGDITQINGEEIEPVDIIVGGSPCQDLSVAGKRAGLEGARSGLFMDQVRIVKEMRNATRRETSDRSNEIPRPRYMVWENVPGAFSSNKGEDFRAVLEETARVADPTISIPRSVNGWANAGSILADRFSISWRTFDAQYWGVPQRRRRIYLVADFGGQSSPEILFESEGMPGNIAEGGETGQRIAADAERSTGKAGELVLNDQGGSVIDVSYGVTGTLRAQAHGHQPVVVQSEPTVCRMVAFGEYSTDGTCSTMKQRDYKDATDLVVEPICFEPRSQDGVHRIHGDISPTLNTAQGGQRQPCIATYSFQRSDELEASDVASTQSARQYKSATDLVVKPRGQGVIYGQTKETNAREILQLLQQEIGEKDLSEWGFRVLTALQSQKILRQEMYGKVVLQTRNGIKVLGYDALEGKAEEITRKMRDMSEAECKRCSPQRRKPSEQLTREFATYMSELSQQDSPKEKFVQDMWETGQGAWVLRETLPEIQKIWESVCIQKKSTHTVGSVRRLTVKECERLQGYPDGWTALDHEDKPVSNTQRYKALGNSFAVPNALFVISRCVKQLQKEQVNERD